jgi:hypothetical protein
MAFGYWSANISGLPLKIGVKKIEVDISQKK